MSSKVNKVNGENLQDPPIKNPGYTNGGTSRRRLKDYSGAEMRVYSVNM